MNASALEKAQGATTDAIEATVDTAQNAWQSFKNWYSGDGREERRKRRNRVRELPTN
jgi:hypothetical protein